MRHKKIFTLRTQLLSDHQVIECYLTINQIKSKCDQVLDIDGVYVDGEKIFDAKLNDGKVTIKGLKYGNAISSFKTNAKE